MLEFPNPSHPGLKTKPAMRAADAALERGRGRSRRGGAARSLVVAEQVVELVALLLLHQAVEVIHAHAAVAGLVGVVEHRLAGEGGGG